LNDEYQPIFDIQNELLQNGRIDSANYQMQEQQNGVQFGLVDHNIFEVD
jgi:hypothetical protein